MRITIIGWYGTETIGDRAILAGLISFFSKSFKSFEIKLGSLYPFFSERTLNEDCAFYKEITGKGYDIKIFNSKKPKELVNAIKNSDLIVMGGGPLMDLNELFMVEYAFKKAKKLGVKTALLGCGVGPLFNKKYRKSVLEISLHSDIHILRDSQSKNSLSVLYKEFKKTLNLDLIHTSFDPAVECVLHHNNNDARDYIAINLRAFPAEYNKNRGGSRGIDNELKQFVASVSRQFSEQEIKLVPMHYFHVGSDDRVFLNSIALDLKLDNITVQNKNLTLKETIDVYKHAYFNIGMRFHAVVLQTIVSGKNFVLDYTEPGKGKINSFLKDIDKNEFYKNRYLSMQEDKVSTDIINHMDEVFRPEEAGIRSVLNIYTELLTGLSK
ncbi:MAG: polysaccharide pyruvyl transferase family protein [Gammaproteobacteria bacterium]